jgi:hypothetical protein
MDSCRYSAPFHAGSSNKKRAAYANPTRICRPVRTELVTSPALLNVHNLTVMVVSRCDLFPRTERMNGFMFCVFSRPPISLSCHGSAPRESLGCASIVVPFGFAPAKQIAKESHIFSPGPRKIDCSAPSTLNSRFPCTARKHVFIIEF